MTTTTPTTSASQITRGTIIEAFRATGLEPARRDPLRGALAALAMHATGLDRDEYQARRAFILSRQGTTDLDVATDLLDITLDEALAIQFGWDGELAYFWQDDEKRRLEVAACLAYHDLASL